MHIVCKVYVLIWLTSFSLMCKPYCVATSVFCCDYCFLLLLLLSFVLLLFFFFCCFVLCMLFVARCSLLGLFLAFLFFFYANVYIMGFFCPATVFFFCCLILCMLFVACSVLGLFLCFFVFCHFFVFTGICTYCMLI